MTASDQYDVVIVGGGPAALAAGLYAARDRFRTALLEKNGLPGGQIMLTERIENYPGYKNIAGPDLIQAMREQTESFGAELLTDHGVDSLRRRDDGLIEVGVNTGERTLLARAVILAVGSDYRKLGVPGEEEMRQATRVSYCATCDGAFYRDKHVLTVGGGNTAVEDTIYLATRFARKVTMIHRRTEFRAQQVLVEELRSLEAGDKRVEVKLPYVLEAIIPTADGSDLDHVRIRNLQTGAAEDLRVDGVFVFVGMVPNTLWLRGTLAMNEAGYVACNPVTLETSMPGVFVAGDCRQQAAMQLATASADGVVAAMMLKQYFRNPAAWGKASANEAAGSGW
ncbi:MAG: FAD-dependent oxidoreductase [Phycisphaerae bacterium]|jgi:thioredoxin reductase (NADPH)